MEDLESATPKSSPLSPSQQQGQGQGQPGELRQRYHTGGIVTGSQGREIEEKIKGKKGRPPSTKEILFIAGIAVGGVLMVTGFLYFAMHLFDWE